MRQQRGDSVCRLVYIAEVAGSNMVTAAGLHVLSVATVLSRAFSHRREADGRGISTASMAQGHTCKSIRDIAFVTIDTPFE